MTAATLCRTCGTELRLSAKFCDECGAPTASAILPAEYKQVTVLFADVVHSMDIASALGTERLREIMTDLFSRSAVVVRRHGGTVDKFTGDGIMAVFGAPVALEDHALRGCLAALGIQQEAKRLAAEVERQDGIVVALRVGLNSGQVIAGEIGSGPAGYTALGAQVGMAQRMESVAPSGGVLLSESTARLVEHVAALAESEMVRIKGSSDPVPARRLLAIAAEPGRIGRRDASLVGRQWEMNTVTGILDRSTSGHGCLVNIVGPPGIGKSRLVWETAAIARRRGVEVLSTFCESHTSDVPFHVVARLLRAAFGVSELDGGAARARVRARVPDADPQDVLLLDDLLGIADPDMAPPRIDPAARRRRLTALINAASLARETPALYVIEDAHWIDEVSESMLADFLPVIPQTVSMVLVTYRPEYRGALAQMPSAHTIALAPLNDSETSALVGELLGSDPSVGQLGTTIVSRAAGNPFFAEEIVRDLAERGVLDGDRGRYICRTDIAEVSVPATLQAAIAARIDRLDPAAKQTLSAAAVIGSRFGTELFSALGIDPITDELLKAELIDQVRFTPRAEYAFHHPLIRTVAYESQLKSDRAELHRRLTAAIEAANPESADENAALIAEHAEAAGDLRAAYGWHMRAGTWSTNRDIVAARLSWERARQVSDALPAEDPDRTAMRIAPRALLCGSACRGWRENIAGTRFDELRELCTAAGDKASLAVGITGLVGEHLFHGRVRQASQQVHELMALIESIGDPTLTIGLSAMAIGVKLRTGEMADVLRWSDTVVELADGDPAKGNFLIASPLAAALASRGLARASLGRPGWREDLDRAVVMMRRSDPGWEPLVIAYKYASAIPNGVLVADDSALTEIDEVLQIAQRLGDDVGLGIARLTMGLTLLHRDSADAGRGLELLMQVRDSCLHERFFMSELPINDVYAARQRARGRGRDGAIPLIGAAVDRLFDAGQLGWCIPGTAVLVEALLDRGTEGDVTEAEAAIDRLAATPAGEELVLREIMVLRLRALLARARDDEVAYRDLVDRYRAMATALGFEGHMAWAGAMR
jgi:adenylate cyclase